MYAFACMSEFLDFLRRFPEPCGCERISFFPQLPVLWAISLCFPAFFLWTACHNPPPQMHDMTGPSNFAMQGSSPACPRCSLFWGLALTFFFVWPASDLCFFWGVCRIGGKMMGGSGEGRPCRWAGLQGRSAGLGCLSGGVQGEGK